MRKLNAIHLEPLSPVVNVKKSTSTNVPLPAFVTVRVCVLLDNPVEANRTFWDSVFAGDGTPWEVVIPSSVMLNDP